MAATGFTGDAYSIKSSLTSLAGKASKEVMQLSAVRSARLRRRSAQGEVRLLRPAALQAGDVSGYGGNFLPTQRSRDVGAVFGEANIPTVKNLEANVAVRYDHYEGVGSSTTPKASLRWQPMPQLLLRTSWGEGFRAPSLQDLYLPMQTSVTPVGLSDPDRCPVTNNGNDCQTQFNVQLGGEPKLKPEKSKNFTLGAVLEPVNNVSFGIDYFSVRLENTIVNGVNLGDHPGRHGAVRQPHHPGTADAGRHRRRHPRADHLDQPDQHQPRHDQDFRPRLRRQVAHPHGGHGALHRQRHGDLFHQVRHVEHRRVLHRQRRPHQRGDGRIPCKATVDRLTRGPFGLMFTQNYRSAIATCGYYPSSIQYRTVKSYTTYDMQGTRTDSRAPTLGTRNIARLPKMPAARLVPEWLRPAVR